jgi:hypothetical protein
MAIIYRLFFLELKSDIDYYNEEHIWMFRPILKPMESLTQDDFVRLHLFTQPDQDFVKGSPLSLDYEGLQYLFLKHYDVFGLIEKNLAVEMIN